MKIFGTRIQEEDEAMEAVGIRVFRGELRGAAKRVKKFTTVGYERRILEKDDGTVDERVVYVSDYYKPAGGDKAWVKNKVINTVLWLVSTFAVFFTALTPSVLNAAVWFGVVDLVAIAILAYYTYMLIINLTLKKRARIYYYVRGVLRLKKSSVYLAGCVIFGLITGVIYAIVKKCFEPEDIRCLVGQTVCAVLFTVQSYAVIKQEYVVEPNDDTFVKNSVAPAPEKTKDEIELERLKQLPDVEQKKKTSIWKRHK